MKMNAWSKLHFNLFENACGSEHSHWAFVSHRGNLQNILFIATSKICRSVYGNFERT